MKIKSQKFIILSYSRTGSNLLVELLNNHPVIRCEGEILGKVKDNINYSSLLSNIFNVKNKIKGFKLFYYHPVNIKNNKKLFETIQLDKSIKIIFLHRENLVRRYYSLLKAQDTSIWKKKDKLNTLDNKKKINISINNLLNSIKIIENYEKKYIPLFKNHNHIIINYEDLEVDYQKTCNKIFKFLNICRFNVNPSLVKMNTGNLYELIENYDEINEYFKSNKHPRVILN